ncbi:hypothetical protein CFOL_v3_13591 [Cephalotus follicularis]|uniref:Uncharacterized protein n=1 Tax=Cephalotus follicularis TaxID=3775 RepID=A0A1Q3BQW4_CEPFO|nr:hypothetical protein CFOL_v3_13591 [Cephalotus follicularis]
MTPNSILTKDVNKLFQNCRKLYPFLKVNQIHYKFLSPTKIEKRNLTNAFLQRNKTLEKHFKSFTLENFLVCKTIRFYLYTLCANHSMHEKENFPKTFICRTIFSFVLQEMEYIEDTLSPTEIKKIMSDTLSPTETNKIMSDTLSFTKIRIRFLQRNETFEKRLQSLWCLKKFLCVIQLSFVLCA